MLNLAGCNSISHLFLVSPKDSWPSILKIVDIVGEFFLGLYIPEFRILSGLFLNLGFC